MWSAIAWVLSKLWMRIRQSGPTHAPPVPVKMWLLLSTVQLCGWFVFYAGFKLPAAAFEGVPGTRLAFYTFPVVTTAFCILVYSTERRLESARISSSEAESQ